MRIIVGVVLQPQPYEFVSSSSIDIVFYLPTFIS